MTVHDVIVLGGGPAGLTCARELSDAGLEVLLLEKEKIGQRPRSWITWRSGLEKYGFKDCIINRIDTLIFSSFLGAEYSLKRSDAAIVDTEKLLQKMKKQAQASGALIHEKEAVLGCRQNKKNVAVRTLKREYTCYYCIDSTGWNSPIQRKLSNKMPRSSYMGCYAVEITGLKNINDIFSAQIFDAAFPGRDYFWLLPYNKNKALAGCFAFEALDAKSSGRMKDSLNKYMDRMELKGRVERVIQGNIPLVEREHFTDKRIFFCGDSISSPLPSSGFGLLRAIDEAKLLSSCIKKGFISGNIKYEEKLVEFRYPGYELHYLASEILKNMDDSIFNKAVSQMKINDPRFIRSFLKGNDMSLSFVSRALIAIFRTFSIREIASMTIRRDYMEFLMRAARDYPKFSLKKIRQVLIGLLKSAGKISILKDMYKIKVK